MSSAQFGRRLRDGRELGFGESGGSYGIVRERGESAIGMQQDALSAELGDGRLGTVKDGGDALHCRCFGIHDADADAASIRESRQSAQLASPWSAELEEKDAHGHGSEQRNQWRVVAAQGD